MTIPLWPATLPRAGAMNVRGNPQSNVISFKPERGPSIDRRAASSVVKIRSVSITLNADQYVIFMDFFTNDLKDGVLAFDWVEPMTNAPARIKFLHEEQKTIDEERLSNSLYRISFRVQVLHIYPV
jgi:hypothetical protein